MSEHALSVIEFRQALAWVAARAYSDPGREAVRDLVPSCDVARIRRELTRVRATGVLLRTARPWVPPVVPDVRAVLPRVAVEGGALDPSELFALSLLLAAGDDVHETISRHPSERDELGDLRDRLYRSSALLGRIRKSVDESGQVLDSASPELSRLRQSIRKTQQTLVRKLESFVRDLPDRLRVPHASISLREGRYVVPVRREGKRDVGGIVHDESATGATLFVEPPVALGLMNELRGLEREEAREIHRILLELSESCRPHAAELEASFHALVELDTLCARARAANEWDGSPPELSDAPDAPYELVQARHPLLASRADVDVVPFDLSLAPDERVLVLSGPNTGGKSVLLKAVGLVSALAQSGVVPPVGPGTRLPVFRTFYADIGDEQSISRDLSTFSAHLVNLRALVEGADTDSLVLIDEMGTGTDPGEGAALARAVLERLVAVRARVVATSHLGALKRLDEEGSGIVNASLQFDPDRMEPTYQLVKGRPGRSFGLAIAEREGLPEAILDAARSHLDEGEASIEDLLERLDRQEKEAQRLVASLQSEREEAERLRIELEAREKELDQLEKDAERKARDSARRILMEARTEVEEAIEEVRKAKDDEALEESSRSARRRVEKAAARQRDLKPEPERVQGTGTVEVGDLVRVVGSGAEGVVSEIRDDKVVVETSGLRLQVSASDLERVADRKRPRPQSAPGAVVWHPDPENVSTEVDLRGLRVEEVEMTLAPALDRAVVTELPELRIIHGMGTGAVRERVTELLRSDGRVAEFRLGGRGEGGGGVTVVRFR